MAAGAGGARGEHDAHDRAFFAGLLVVLGLLGSGAALVHRTHLAHSSRPGDACPVTASGGLVGFDARTGAVRWTSIIPPDAVLRADPTSGTVHVLTDESIRDDENLQVDRTVDAATGRITRCTRGYEPLPAAEHDELLGFPEPLATPIHLGHATIVNWGDGIRATDPTDTGIWGVEATQAEARIGNDLIVSTRHGDQAGTARLDLRTGEERWSVDERFVSVGGGGTLVLTSDRRDFTAITARNADTGKERWSSHLPWPDPRSDPWDIGGRDLGRLVVFPSGAGGRLVAIDSATGRVAWEGAGGTPGANWKYSEPGSITSVASSPDGTTVVATVDAVLPEDEYD